MLKAACEEPDRDLARILLETAGVKLAGGTGRGSLFWESPPAHLRDLPLLFVPTPSPKATW